MTVEISSRHGVARVVDRVSLEVWPGEIVGLIGESGSGKTLTALSVLGLAPRAVKIVAGDIRLAGQSLVTLSESERRAIRGERIAFIPQDAMRALNPVLRIDHQVGEPFHIHRRTPWWEARALAAQLLGQVHITDAAIRAREYPHQFSGGMQQRAMIAMGLALEPELLIADEPTTALDVTIQAQVLKLLREIREAHGSAILFITHDLGIVAELCDWVYVIYAGAILEQGPVARLFERPSHPYTQALLGATPAVHRVQEELLAIPGQIPRPTYCPAVVASPTVARNGWRAAPKTRRISRSRPSTAPAAGYWNALMAEPLLSVRNVSKTFAGGGWFGSRPFTAVAGVDFTLNAGESFGIVGESGSGKSTLLRLILGLLAPTTGDIVFESRTLGALARAEWLAVRRRMQVVFQDPSSSFNPRQSVAQALLAPLEVHGIGDRRSRAEQVVEMLERVGLNAGFLRRLPHQLSGGQRQRVAIARAIILQPALLLLDEPTSALDVSVQAQVLNLLKKTQRDLGLASIFVSHNLGVIRYVSDRVAVMYQGRFVETGASHEVFTNPRHGYTQALLAAVPDAGEGWRRQRAAPA
ncbi:MAG: ABC transporter ATP-binding protein [Gammaproteobacteria bacterium]